MDVGLEELGMPRDEGIDELLSVNAPRGLRGRGLRASLRDFEALRGCGGERKRSGDRQREHAPVERQVAMAGSFHVAVPRIDLSVESARRFVRRSICPFTGARTGYAASLKRS